MTVENNPSGTGSTRKARPAKRPFLEWIGSDLAGSSGRGVVAFGVISVLSCVFCFITQIIMEEEGLVPSGSTGGGRLSLVMKVELALVAMFTMAFLVSLAACIVRTPFIGRVTDQIGAHHGLSYFVAGSVFMAVGAIPYGQAVAFLAAVVAVPARFAGGLCLAVGYRLLWQRACDVGQWTGASQGDDPLLTGHGRVSRGVEYALTGTRLWGPLCFLLPALLTFSPDHVKIPHVLLAPNWPAACLIVAHTVLGVLFEVSFLAWLLRRVASGEVLGRMGRRAGTMLLLGGIALQGVGSVLLLPMVDSQHPNPLLLFCMAKGFVFLLYVLIGLGWMLRARHAAPEGEPA